MKYPYTLKDFFYNLPEELIAKYPCKERSKCKLLCFNKTKNEIKHKVFKNIKEYFMPGDLLILNDSKVMNARLFGKKETGGKVEVFIERILDKDTAIAHIKSSKRMKTDSIVFVNDKKIKILRRHQYGPFSGLFEIKILSTNVNFYEFLSNYGEVPLPPYMYRKPTDDDLNTYQTVYANELGSIAAPTAGLHFDDNLLNKIKEKGVGIERVTLHVGSGTFTAVKEHDIRKHKMHAEHVEISLDVCNKIIETKQKNGRVIAVGTTSVRTLESAAQKALTQKDIENLIVPYSGDTSIFITPGYKFKIIDALITNFHIPSSTLLMLVCALAGYDKEKDEYDDYGHKNMIKVYENAIKNKYKFYSYGDAMFIY